jgi:hypothetical protein
VVHKFLPSDSPEVVVLSNHHAVLHRYDNDYRRSATYAISLDALGNMDSLVYGAQLEHDPANNILSIADLPGQIYFSGIIFETGSGLAIRHLCSTAEMSYRQT